jgi:hypothetical protein
MLTPASLCLASLAGSFLGRVFRSSIAMCVKKHVMRRMCAILLKSIRRMCAIFMCRLMIYYYLLSV